MLADASRPSPFLDELAGARPHTPAAAPGTGTRTTARIATKTAASASTPESSARESALRAWRTERARADAMPPYIVASNKLVAAIAAADPTTAAELFAVSGMGPVKLELYGDEILALLDDLR